MARISRAAVRKMRTDTLCNDQRRGKRRGRCALDVMQRALAAIVLVASLHRWHNALRADALSLPGKRVFRRASHASTSTGLGRVHGGAAPHHDKSFGADRSRAPPSSPFRSGRLRMGARERRRLFRRKGDFQLHYKEHDDDLLNIVESQQPIRRGIFRWRNRKSLSKALFPPEEEGSLETATLELDDLVSDPEEVPELRATTITKPATGVGMKKRAKKKKDQVTVTNIRELHEAILDRGLELRDVDLDYSPPPSLLSSEEPQPIGIVADDSDEFQTVLLSNDLDAGGMDSQLLGLFEHNEPLNAEEWQLIGNVLAEDAPFPKEDDAATAPFSHDVLNLLQKRYRSKSTPMSRAPDDTSVLALTIEGGGMRGAVSSGMAAAIACLGLSNAFDSVYGSSAGSIIGSYFVSRQLHLDVYTDVIPAGKDFFVRKSKIISDIFRNMFHVTLKGPLGKRLNANLIERFKSPAAGSNSTYADESLPPTRAGGLNISFVLDSIMCPGGGLRPLDLEAFAHNDAVQPLRIVSSAVELETGKLKSICFGSKEGHFSDQFGYPEADSSARDSATEYLYPEVESAVADEKGNRRGLWSCLGASMTVPGAAGSPFRMDLPASEGGQPTAHLCFDAFCYEPVPFRSAVAEGASHVLALRSRPAGYEPKTKPTLYERAVAPLYFRSHGVSTVAEFFEKGGQQYLYAEDVLICDQGLNSTTAIPIPPAKVLYADPERQNGGCSESASETDREQWARAHLLPITVPADVPELAVLSQDRDDILAGVRSGFAAAYDALAPVVGLEIGPDALNGRKVAELVFPAVDAPQESVLQKQFPLAGEKLGTSARASEEVSPGAQAKETAENADLSSAPRRNARFRRLLSLRRAFRFRKGSKKIETPSTLPVPATDTHEADMLLSILPGVQLGSLPTVAERIASYLEGNSFLEDA